MSAVALAAKEYRNGVPAAGGRVTDPEEVAEARLFLEQARHEAASLPDSLGQGSAAAIALLQEMLAHAAPPDSVDHRADAIVQRVTAGFGGALDPYPSVAPSVARGSAVFQQECAQCHGRAGLGDGPAGHGLKPLPANLADPVAMGTVSPLDVYRKVTIGVAGTAMPRFDGRLSSNDRWAVAAYVSTLRSNPRTVHEGEGIYALQCAGCHGSAGDGNGALARTLSVQPPALRDLAVQGRFSDVELATLVAHGRAGTPMPPFSRALDSAAAARVVAFVRTLPAASGPRGTESRDAATLAFAEVRRQLDSAVAHRSAEEAFDAYLAFEQVETEVRARNAPLAGELEDAFANLRNRAAAGAGTTELETLQQQLLGGLERAERAVADKDSSANLFLESLGITLREGFEAILIIGALMAFLAKAGAPERRRDVAWGAWLAVAASLATFAGVELLFEVTSNQREALEGWTMLLATIVLFYVSYWLLSKIEADKWNAFVRGKVTSALSSGSRWALAGVAFLAVYREGFETILFYKALLTSGSTGGVVAVLGGLGLGAVGLVVIYIAINRFGMRLPLRPFFAITGGLLYYMAFVFAGKGVAELQNAGVIGMKPVEWGPRLPVLGVYPTAQSLAAQGVLLLLALVALLWVSRGAGSRKAG